MYLEDRARRWARWRRRSGQIFEVALLFFCFLLLFLFALLFFLVACDFSGGGGKGTTTVALVGRRWLQVAREGLGRPPPVAGASRVVAVRRTES
ncbi:hypothetical protein ES288_D13G272300v1 [Gossypium darwinii]|uniref:Uncharacterized protein n=1 Tax=Gossypium darwinii TaxID=34276 RepID=A0A5D2A2F7_GOSDA|nr:hypothetical protein ES288_D13G272300v1 [Gossypium darwinii]